VVSLDFLNMQRLVKPECLLEKQDNVYFRVQSLRFGGMLCLLFVLTTWKKLRKAVAHIACCQVGHCGDKMMPPQVDLSRATDEHSRKDIEERFASERRSRAADRWELWQTLVFQLQVAMSFRFCLAIFDKWGQGEWAAVAVLLGVLLLLVNATMIAKYYLHVRALVFGQNLGAVEWQWRGGMRVASLPPERLARRLAYFIRRFNENAPFWQFVIWARQLLLLLTSFLPRWYVPYALEEEATSNAAYRAVVVTHACAAMAIFGLAWALHARVRPYAFVFQNKVESWLFFCNMLTVLLGTLYTFVPRRRAGLEVALLGVLGGSWLGTLAYILWSYWRERRGGEKLREAEAVELPRSMTWAFRPTGAAAARTSPSPEPHPWATSARYALDSLDGTADGAGSSSPTASPSASPATSVRAGPSFSVRARSSFPIKPPPLPDWIKRRAAAAAGAGAGAGTVAERRSSVTPPPIPREAMRLAAGGDRRCSGGDRRCSGGDRRCSGGERLSAVPPPLPEELSGAGTWRATEDEGDGGSGHNGGLGHSGTSGGGCARVWRQSQKTATDDDDSTSADATQRSSLMSRSSVGAPTGIDGTPSVHRHTSIELAETSEPRPPAYPPRLPPSPWQMPPVAPLPRPGGKNRRDTSKDRERNSLVSAQL